MAKFILSADSGVQVPADSTTIAGAKREASRWMSFGGGSVAVLDAATKEPLCVRPFWQHLNRFGWDAWVTL